MEPKAVKCECGFSFCFACSADWHEPITCNMLKTWMKKCSDDSETTNWLSLNTKDCPKCGTMIEKNGGCNHMTCKSKSCRFEFCWLCLQPYDSTHNCNRYHKNIFF